LLESVIPKSIGSPSKKVLLGRYGSNVIVCWAQLATAKITILEIINIILFIFTN
jgi:hypothetical protein